MKWSLPLGRIAGIRIQVHATFALLLIVVVAGHYHESGTLVGVGKGLGLVAAVFGIIVLHELGHALAARQFGIGTRDITLLPIGGVSRLERFPEKPWQELTVALAGPAVNVVLAAVLAVGSLLATGAVPTPQVADGIVAQLLLVNVMLALFNLLPAFPMDGGRVFRAILAMHMTYVDATRTAAQVGQLLALLFGIAGLLGNPMLLFIAFFVWLGASEEAAMVQLKATLGGVSVSRTMVTEFHRLESGEPVGHAVEQMLAGYQQDFPVVDEGRVVGLLTQADVMKALAKGGESTPVRDVMEQVPATAAPAEMLEAALPRMQQAPGHALPVVDDGRLVGMLTAENVGEFVMVQSALQGKKP